jgi:hypothetical protein
MRNTNLPINKFLLLTMVGHRQPDPVPRELVLAALLFVVTALMAF